MDNYIHRFEKLGFGLFVHFGIYSVLGKGEWAEHNCPVARDKYRCLTKKFTVAGNWAKALVKTAKRAGCKYITLTTRHHDGFSLYDTKGLSSFDAPHSAAGRDLVREFVDACNAEGIVPFFYHTLLDWDNPDYKENFPAYIDYLVKSIEILCAEYGKIGGFWFDGMWDKKDADWQEDRLYGTIRKYQPEAMIINNTGLEERGKTGHPEIDSVTFERGKPCFVNSSEKHIAGEMCQVMNDHWGYAKDDCNYKSVRELIVNLVDCRRFGCNFLLNTGPKGNGLLNGTDKALLGEIGKWVKKNKGFIYDAKPCEITAENADMLCDSIGLLYAVLKDFSMDAEGNVPKPADKILVKVNADIKNAVWLDNGKRIEVKNNSFRGQPFPYGTSLPVRIAKIKIK